MSSVARAASLAVACPGQGIVPRGCLAALRRHQHVFQHTLDCVDLVFGAKVSALLVQDPPAAPDPWSRSTANAQPAIVASTYALIQVLRAVTGIDLMADGRVAYFLGHSLGEYSALLLAGVLTLPQALHVARQRGLMMEALVREKAYEMRVLVFRPAAYGQVHGLAAARGVLACANNASQILVLGEPGELDALVHELNTPRKTVLKQVLLPVAVPFHNRVLRAIEPRLLDLVPRPRPALKPVVSNFTGGVSAGNLFENTVRCNSAPVQWKASMELLERAGVGAVVNLGPGSAVDAINAKFGLANYPVKCEADMQRLAAALSPAP
ncbi:FabD/lysophospholipase-like protein [Metschnikowia bicuspidata var. bicuspidata NRRL YB-4993]|uniref:[acyl-carrier-protein] S-malonyltransferase n=1 Tax=Metschnikowia bicuspidata var. bicuspidata NRRL YB-4993 TaxID=869754 RepID=A0A1A0HBL1_9ASCO|nr:FabD/lysophospholipase-like protein [Metschnikowia bicuspidata var. bicuspidata NRRL YB-4993]OBA21524.1 FabD/lysophospholipase-like protein [Metschnikowia bicuspidata var. bicuspidata NRRL YB-4993]